MRIGMIVDNEYHPDVRVRREAKLLRGLGHEVHVLCLDFGTLDKSEPSGIAVHYVAIRKKWKDAMYFFMNLIPLYEWWWRWHVSRFVRQQEIDVVHTHDLYMARGVYMGIKASGRKTPMVLDLHENYPEAIRSYNWTKGFLRSLLSRPGAWAQKEGKYLRYADRLVVLSEEFGKHLLKKYPALQPDQVVDIANVVDLEEFDSFGIDQEVLATLPRGQVALYFGAVAERRGIFDTLEVARDVAKQVPGFKLMVIGPLDQVDKARFHQAVEGEELRDHVLYIAWIPLSQLPTYMQASQVALAPFHKNPQHESGVANKIFQYMYGKLPVIASDCKPQKELIEQYDFGRVFSTREEFRKVLVELLQNQPLCTEMGENGHKALMQDFHPRKIREQFRKLYESLPG